MGNVRDIGAAYETAANSVQQTGQEAKDQADWLRNWYTQQGLGQAQGYLAPAAGYASGMAGQGPGAFENWYRNASQYYQPTNNQQSAYGQFSSWMNDPWTNQTQAGDRSAQQYLQGPTATSSFYGQNGQGLTSYYGPQNTQTQYYANQPAYNTTGAGEAFYNANQSKYGNDTNSERAYEDLVRQMSSPSYAEDMMKMGLQVQDTTGGLNLLKHQEYAGGPTALQQNEGENKGYIRGANQAANYYQSQLPALAGPGAYENFVTSDIAGANPLYERTRDRGIATINQEMARRGGFKSGAAIDRIGNYTAELDAQDYQNRANRAQQAQQMQLARIGQGQQAALGTAGLDVQRGQALGGLDTQNEQAQAQRQGIGLQAEKQAQDAQLARAGLQLQMTQMADQDRLARLQGTANMANQADSQNLAWLNSGQNAAMDAQNAMLARLSGGMNAANSVDQTRLSSDQQALQRLLGAYGMAQGTDASNLARAQQLFSQGQGVDQSQLARYGMLNNMAQGSDQQSLANYMGMGNMANNAQTAEQQRMQQAYAALLGAGGAQAGLVGNFYNMGGDAYQNFYGAGLGADINAAQLRAQAEQERMQMALALAGLQQQQQQANQQMGWNAFNGGIGLASAFGGGGGRR